MNPADGSLDLVVGADIGLEKILDELWFDESEDHLPIMILDDDVVLVVDVLLPPAGIIFISCIFDHIIVKGGAPGPKRRLID